MKAYNLLFLGAVTLCSSIAMSKSSPITRTFQCIKYAHADSLEQSGL
jgi:hypothetical protein